MPEEIASPMEFFDSLDPLLSHVSVRRSLKAREPKSCSHTENNELFGEPD